MSPKKILLISIPIIFILVLFWFYRTKGSDDQLITAKVIRGSFDLIIFSSGQLESEKFEIISVPEKLNDRNLRIYELTITDLVEEGTIIDSGDYVATLDHKAVEEQIKSAQDEMNRTLTEYEDSKMDSSLNLSNQRDLITNAQLDLVEKKIIMEESVYEAPSIQKKAGMDLDKAKRKLEQEQRSYLLKIKQEENKVERRFINYRQISDRERELQVLFNTLEIRAPKSGILTYYRTPWGEITKTGSKVGIYSGGSIIATIPEMSNLISRTYINEIDISKIKVGQKVKVGIDAFPGKHLEGQVIAVANIGQAMPNSDAKVFEVKIKISGKDQELKPAMTTSNAIEAMNCKDTLMVPSDAIFENDSLRFVYLGIDKPVKQIVWTADENETFSIVRKGLKEGDVVLLTEPENAEEIELNGLSIYEEIKKEKEAAKIKAANEKEEMPVEMQRSMVLPANVRIIK
jgi:multidrug resistance efflux pump